MNVNTTKRTATLLWLSVLAVALMLVMTGLVATAGARPAYAADSQLAAQDLSVQAATDVKNVEVTITPPKVGEKGTSDVVNLENGDVDKNTSISFAFPADAKYFIESYAFCNKDESDLSAPVTFESGKTYYMWITFKGDGSIAFDESSMTFNVKGGELVEWTGSYNYTPEGSTVTSAYTNIILSFTPMDAEKAEQKIVATNKIVQVGKSVKVAAKTTGDGKLTYSSSNKAVAAVSAKGVVTGKKAGKAKITITAAATDSYEKATKAITVTVKKANTLAVKAQTKVLKASTLKTKAVAFNAAVIAKKGEGTTSYAKKAVTKKYTKYVTVSSKGKITVKKGAPKGKCALVLNVKAAGNATYMPATKAAKVTIAIK